MDNIQIIQMNNNDIDEAISLEESHNIHILSKSILENDLKEKNNYYLVAKSNNMILGYIGISYVLDTADIISIVVSHDYTRKGIASLLLNSIYEFCKENNISRIMLEVRETNTVAQNLYLKHGFTKISERKKYYEGKENAYIMEKKIPII
ncbi:MAG: ribosomal protein S18-alanine N-acetyltransferase [Clostridia bacterium]|nr:ribosomal protein S18-alanine N-acetyltransferase [Clostridia bacterium]